MKDLIWNNWFLMAMANPVTWAVACLLDVCLIDRQIYKSPIEGTLISSLFFAVPLIFLLPDGAEWQLATWSGVGYATLSGFCYFLHVFYYFKSLFIVNDASNIETFNLLSVLLIPLLSLVFMSERLPVSFYLAVALAGTGLVSMTCGTLRTLSGPAARNIALSIVMISLSMVTMAMAFNEVPGRVVSSVYLATGIVTACAVIVTRARCRARVCSLFIVFGGLFAVTEFLQISALLASQRAIRLSASASLVALVECALPVLIIVFSLLGLQVMKSARLHYSQIARILRLQLVDWESKLRALALLIIAVVIASNGVNPQPDSGFQIFAARP